MRPGQQQQQNKQRMRGRNNNNRKGPNPLSRSFESNGPDVKIRGTAQHIADKYTTLARDAAASGDRVMAENYLQHAEHYGRIVAAAQGQFQPSQPERDYMDDEDDALEGALEGGAPPMGNGQPQHPQQQPPRDNAFRDNAPRFADGQRPDGNARQDGQRHDGQRQDGHRQNERDGYRDNRRNDRFGRDGGRDPQRDNFAGRGENGPRDAQRDGQPPRPPQGSGPQPHMREPGEGGEDGQPVVAQDGRDNRREGRRDRQRFNDRSGERRFEERFGRPRGDDRPADQPSSADAGEGVSATAPAHPAPQHPERAVAPVAEAPPVPALAPAGDMVRVAIGSDAPETGDLPRRRGRPARRDRPDGEIRGEAQGEVAAVSPAAPPSIPSPVVAGDDPVALAEPKRRAPRAATAPDAPEVDLDAAPKRRPGRPRKKKADDEDGEVAPLPDFLLSSNG